MTGTIELVGPEVILPAFENRYKSLVEKDPDMTFVDPLIRDLIRNMNAIEGVSTAFSCQGRHDPDSNYEDDGYVMFVCKDTQFIENLVMSIWRRIRMNDEIYKDLVPYIPLFRVSSSPRMFLSEGNSTVWYRSSILSWKTVNNDINALWCKVITEAVKSLNYKEI